MKIKITCTIISGSIFFTALSQGTTKQLHTGEKIPEITFFETHNSPNKIIKISDFESKLIIIDFWSSGCKGCISSFPKMEKLQNEFSRDLKILTVTKESQNKISYLLKNSAIIKNTKLTMIFRDSTLYNLFPHAEEPYLVWIDKKGYILGMSTGYSATSANIKAILDGNKNYMLFNSAKLPALKIGKSILMQEKLETVQQYSALVQKRYNSSAIGLLFDTISEKVVETGIFFSNKTMLELFSSAYRLPIVDPIRIELANPDAYFPPVENDFKDEWYNQNFYYYEVKADKSKCHKLMQNDLQIYFNIKSALEKRKVKCLVLQRISKEDNIKCKQPTKKMFIEYKKSYYHLENAYLGNFLELLRAENLKAYRSKALPILDESQYTSRVDIEINGTIEDIGEFNSELKKYGLQLLETERILDILVLREQMQ